MKYLGLPLGPWNFQIAWMVGCYRGVNEDQRTPITVFWGQTKDFCGPGSQDIECLCKGLSGPPVPAPTGLTVPHAMIGILATARRFRPDEVRLLRKGRAALSRKIHLLPLRIRRFLSPALLCRPASALTV